MQTLLTSFLLLSSFAFAQSSDLITFFDSKKIYSVQIQGWNPAWMSPSDFPVARETSGANLRIFRTSSTSAACGEPERGSDVLFQTNEFTVGLSGNKTLGTPKSSYKLKLLGTRFLGMKTLNLKSMWNDVSQMREAIAWDLFRKVGVVAPGHTYAKFCINGRYFGLMSFIENIDKSFVKAHFSNGVGNLFYGSWEESDLGPATLGYRRSSRGDDSGRMYFRNSNPDNRTYSLRTNDETGDDVRLRSYDDLARLVRASALNPSSELESVFNVESYLRWAALNVLMGAWDNYWVTASNYSLYNSGHSMGNSFDNLILRPFFHWIPWDYDNTFGISYDDRRWHDIDLFRWSPQNQPLFNAVIHVPQFRTRYVTILKDILKRYFNPTAIAAQQNRYWSVIETAAYQESLTPNGRPFTGRQFTNDQIYWNGVQNRELRNGNQFILGIIHFVRMRTDSAWRQLNALRH